VPWNDLSRGMGKNDAQANTDEEHLRVFWRRWNELMEARPPTLPSPARGGGQIDLPSHASGGG